MGKALPITQKILPHNSQFVCKQLIILDLKNYVYHFNLVLIMRLFVRLRTIKGTYFK